MVGAIAKDEAEAGRRYRKSVDAGTAGAMGNPGLLNTESHRSKSRAGFELWT
jgi:hypothetical protein